MQVTIQCLRYLGDPCTNSLDLLHDNCDGKIIFNIVCLQFGREGHWTLPILPTPVLRHRIISVVSHKTGQIYYLINCVECAHSAIPRFQFLHLAMTLTRPAPTRQLQNTPETSLFRKIVPKPQDMDRFRAT